MIAAWAEDEDFAVHPKGSQPKRTVTCPRDCADPYLIPGHRYIFKTAKKEWQGNQLWSEVIAYRLAELVGLWVPRCFVAVDENSGEVGVLMEFFFGYPGEKQTVRLMHGGDLLTRVIADRKRGRPHAVRTNLSVCRAYRVPNAASWWGQALVFDALIANVDRHPDNWGILVRYDQTEGRPARIHVEMSPLYDNGTSLGYGLTEAKLVDILSANSIHAFADRGSHHCSWDIADHAAPHVSLCERFAAAHPEAIGSMRNVIRFSDDEFGEIVRSQSAFDVSIPFSANRAKFIEALVQTRKAQLAELLGGADD